MATSATSGARLALFPFPAWIGCAVLLFGFDALGKKSVDELSPAEQAAYYQQFPGGALTAWLFVILGLLAIAVAAIAIFRLAQSGQSRALTAARVLGIGVLVVGVVTTLPMFWLLGADPSNLPSLIEDLPSEVGMALTSVEYASLALGVALAAFGLRNVGVLGRSGKVIGIIGVIFAVISIPVPIPLLHAILLFVLGIVVLRSRSAR